MYKEKKTKPETGISRSFAQNETVLKRFLSRFFYKPEDVDDMAQEAFLRAYSATRDKPIASPKAYLFQVARNLAFKELSKKSRRLTEFLEEAVSEDLRETAHLEEEVAAQQKVKFYCEAIAELPPQCRKVFLMRKVQAKSHKTIAAELGISVSAVEKQVALGIDRCKRFMDMKETSSIASSNGQSNNPVVHSRGQVDV